MKTCLYIFQNNLRLLDNPSLYYAYHNFDRVVPIVIWQDYANGYERGSQQKMGKFRKQFLIESIAELQYELLKKGVDLVILRKDADLTENLAEIIAHYEVQKTITSYPIGTYAQELLGMLCELSPVYTCEDNTLLEKDDLPFDFHQLPKTFTSFRKKVEQEWNIREEVPMPEFSKWDDTQQYSIKLEVPSIARPPNTAFPYKGGEESGRNRLNYYLWESEAITTYKQTRNGMIGEQYSTKFSAFLALGCLSPVTIYHAVRDFEAEHTTNESTYWVIFELLWREFFYWVTEKQRSKIFRKEGIYTKEGNRQSDQIQQEQHKFEEWCTGKTAHSFINANMHELVATGFMSNRGRQNVASYLIHHLQVDWRWGAAFFEQHLLDYDVCNNWCNWLYLAGVGNDPRSRVFNPDRQQQNYDADGKYVALWG